MQVLLEHVGTCDGSDMAQLVTHGKMLTFTDQELVLGGGQDVVGLYHGRNMAGTQCGIVGGLGGIPRWRWEDAESCDQQEVRHGGLGSPLDQYMQ